MKHNAVLLRPVRPEGKPILRVIWPDGKLPYPKEELLPNIQLLFDLLSAVKNNSINLVRCLDCCTMRSPEAKILNLRYGKRTDPLFLLYQGRTAKNTEMGISVEVGLRRPLTDLEMGELLTAYRKKVSAVKQEQSHLKIVPTPAPVVHQPVTRPVRYTGEYLEDEEMKKILGFLKERHPNKPETVTCQDVYVSVRIYFSTGGYTKDALDGFLTKNFEAFARKTLDETAWQINWRGITAFIHGEDRPKFCNPFIPKVANLSLAERIALYKAQPAMRTQLAEIEAEIAKYQAQLDALRMKSATIEAQLKCTPFSPDELAALEGMIAQQ